MEKNSIIWEKSLFIAENPTLTIIDNCLFSLSNGLLSLSEAKSPEKIGQIPKTFFPKSSLRFPHVQISLQITPEIKPFFITINKEGEIFIEDYEKNSVFSLKILYVFDENSDKIKPINEITYVFDDILIFFQGKYDFEAQNSKSSFFFEIPIEFSPEIDIVTFQSRKTKENHARLVVHSSGIIQIKPQVDILITGCFVLKLKEKYKENEEKSEENEEKKEDKISIKIPDKEIVVFLLKFNEPDEIISSNIKGFLLKGNLVIIEGLIEFSSDKENRVFLRLEEKFLPKTDVFIENCLKEKWDFTIITIRTDGNVESLRGKSLWLHLVYFI